MSEETKVVKPYGLQWWLCGAIMLIVIAAAATGALSTDLAGSFALMLSIGILCNEIGERIPFWEDAKQLVCDLHPRLAHFGIISWDVTLDESGVPKIIEYNLIDSLIDWHQIFIGPILGDKEAELLPKLLKKNPYLQA